MGAILLTLVVGAVIGAVVSRATDNGPNQTTNGHGHHSGSATGGASLSSGTLEVVAISPTNGTTGVHANTPITITFSSGLAAHSPLPTLTPTTAGNWHVRGSTLTFTPTTDFTPLSLITLAVPAGRHGVIGNDGGRLSRPVTQHFKIANGSVSRLQQLLALLDYSPLTWTASTDEIASTNSAAQIAALYNPPAGTYSWRHRGWPRRLRAMWQPGTNNLFTRGLVMSFQADRGLTPNGHVTVALWSALLTAIAANTVNTGGYNYALVDKAAPERLTIYHDGTVALRTPANTGIATSPTPDGTFTVYTRLRQQVMRGTNPNGQHYADLVQYIAYFHGNDAVHYMDRADYGIPQSLGCVELPLADAALAWPYLAYGTLVTVIN